jgi:hypothetical protein
MDGEIHAFYLQVKRPGSTRDLNERAFNHRSSLDECRMNVKTGGVLRTVPIPSEQPEEFMFQSNIELNACAVGIPFHRKEDRTFGPGKLLLWDRDRRELEFCMLPDFRTNQCRRVCVTEDDFNLRLVVIGSMIEAYMNDELVLNEFWPPIPGRSLRFYCENGETRFCETNSYER